MRMPTIVLAPAALLLVSSVALAQPQSRQAPPAAGAPRPFTVPAAETFSLPNGLGVTLVPYGTVPKATIHLSVDVGNADEGPQQVWLADLTGQLMKEGTTTQSAAAIAERLARMGGGLTVGVGLDATTVRTDVLSEFVADALPVIADVVQHPALPAAELPRLKADLRRNLALQKSQPQAQAFEAFSRVMYGDHPYGRIFPTEAMLEGYGHGDVTAFHAAHFGASRAHLYVVGRFDAAAVRAAVRASFASWAAGTAPRRTVATPVVTRSLTVIDRPKAAQSTLYLGLPVVDPSHPDYMALRVMNALLGGSFASRVTTNIREQKGYTYSPNSSLTPRQKVAHWAQVADVTTAVTGASMKEIFFEIDRLRTEAPPVAELDGIKAYLSGVFVLQNSSRSGIINQLLFQRQHGLPEDYLRTYVQQLQAVTPDDIRRVTEKYLDPAKMTMVVVGDQAVVKEQLQPYEAH
ncbi:peptidase M16 [Luteitalea sp. TBR-22]|uniref:M16 family metallopeptidase n=1 Tax=Luteitalea sp. TBR-22 TaxID=2802971 RepID=UPI001AF8346F|nr:pitrilysin family protein [Luteitalea sp. TBR-22]BCS35552.1 peptidase M16 [Luteitalea sp. TBR-22]